LFVGNQRRGKSFTALASLSITAKLNGVNPEVWLAGVLERVISGKVTANQHLPRFTRIDDRAFDAMDWGAHTWIVSATASPSRGSQGAAAIPK